MYAYPKFDTKVQNPFCAIAAPGLGNCLFPWARAIVFALENDARLIHPEWFQFNMGPLLRGSKSRNYGADFLAHPEDVCGMEKLRVLFKYPRYCEYEWAFRQSYGLPGQNYTVEMQGMKDWFRSLNPNRLAIADAIRERLRRPYREFSGYVGVHVRLGDFAVASREELHEGARNVRAPYAWYKDVLASLLQSQPTAKFVYFTDAKASELAELTGCYPGEIVSGQSAINDMFSLASTDVIVGTRSTFALWAYFFSNARLCLPWGKFMDVDWLPMGAGIDYFK
jgi:hypothetical protein